MEDNDILNKPNRQLHFYKISKNNITENKTVNTGALDITIM